MPSVDLAVLDVGCVNKGAQCRPCEQKQSNDKGVLYFFCLFNCQQCVFCVSNE